MKRLRKRLTQPDFFEDAAVGINCESGFIAFAGSEKGKPTCIRHSMEHRRRDCHPGSWSEDADNPALAKIARDKFAVCFRGDEDAEQKLDLLFEIPGAAMRGMCGRKNSRAVIFLGETAENGKSTILDVLCSAMPAGSVSHVAAKDFKDKNAIAQLRSKLLNTTAEVGAAIGDEEFKKIVTGDDINAKNLWEDIYSFRPGAQHVLAANRMPAFPGGIGHEIRRRLLILTFNRSIPKEEQDESVERLAETHPNELLAAIVEGASRYIRPGGFTIPASSDEAMQEWSQTTDPVLSWLADRVERLAEVGNKTRTTTAYSDFKRYCWVELQMQDKDIPGRKSFIVRVKAACRSNPAYENIEHSHSDDSRGFKRMRLKPLTVEMLDGMNGADIRTWERDRRA